MEISIYRYCKPQYTIRHLFFNDQYFCDTLEDPVRDLNHNGNLDEPGEGKIMHQTAIPCGTYRLIMDYSHRFKRPMPRILDVHKFTGILIHSGNTTNDTSGCILVGQNKIKGRVVNSTAIFKTFLDKIRPYLINGNGNYIKLKIYDFPKKSNV